MTFYTPTYRRPGFLKRCQESVCAQTLQDWQHLIIRDEIGIGVPGVFREVQEHVDEIEGEYVYFLQDDDILAGPEVLQSVCSFRILRNYPPVIMVKNRKIGRILPDYWIQEPQLGHVDLGSYIVRADVFRENAYRFGERYQGDYDFIHSLWGTYRFTWMDLLFARAQCWGQGRPEDVILASDVKDVFLEVRL
jgi:glycosyltransferase involved in cell wall biosynthesis